MSSNPNAQLYAYVKWRQPQGNIHFSEIETSSIIRIENATDDKYRKIQWNGAIREGFVIDYSGK